MMRAVVPHSALHLVRGLLGMDSVFPSVSDGVMMLPAVHHPPLVALKLVRGLPDKENASLNVRNILMINLVVSLKEHLYRQLDALMLAKERPEMASVCLSVRNGVMMRVAVPHSVLHLANELQGMDSACLNVRNGVMMRVAVPHSVLHLVRGLLGMA